MSGHRIRMVEFTRMSRARPEAHSKAPTAKYLRLRRWIPSLTCAVALVLGFGAKAPLAAELRWGFEAVLEDVVPVYASTPGSTTEALLGSLALDGSSIGSTAQGVFSLTDSGPDEIPEADELGILEAVQGIEVQAGGISVFTAAYTSGGPFTASANNPGFPDLVWFWIEAVSLPHASLFFPRGATMVWVGGDASAFLTTPFAGAPPSLSSLEPYRAPISPIGDDFVTSFTIDGEFESGEGAVPYQLVYRLTALAAVPEPALAAPLAGVLIALGVLRASRTRS
jgi:hypothetical protein